MVEARALLALWAALAAALEPVLPVAPTGAPPEPLVVQINYDGSQVPGQADYAETLANLVYPLTKGPLSLGYPLERLPVILWLRGGNSNEILPGSLVIDPTSFVAKDAGFVGIACNYPIVGPGEDYNVAVAGVALLVQYLRANADALNIAPDRIVTMGRSFGTIVGNGLNLKQDHQDLASSDPVRHESSRPNYWAPRFGPSSLSCFANDTGPWASVLSTFYFPGLTFEEATPEMKVLESPYWWLVNPQLFGRTYTPPICITFNTSHGDTCGKVTDVHSGIFGEIVLEAIDEYVRQTGDRRYRERCFAVDRDVFPDPTVAIIAWAVQRMAEDYDGLYLLPPSGVVGSSGGNVALRIFGAQPGATIWFFTGSKPASFPIAGCPALEGRIEAFETLGSAVANQNGVALLSFFVEPSALGKQVLFHTVDLEHCEMSNLSVHTYY